MIIIPYPLSAPLIHPASRRVARHSGFFLDGSHCSFFSGSYDAFLNPRFNIHLSASERDEDKKSGGGKGTGGRVVTLVQRHKGCHDMLDNFPPFVYCFESPTTIWAYGLRKRGGGIGVPSFCNGAKKKKGGTGKRGMREWAWARIHFNVDRSTPHHATHPLLHRTGQVSGWTNHVFVLFGCKKCSKGEEDLQVVTEDFGDTLTLGV